MASIAYARSAQLSHSLHMLTHWCIGALLQRLTPHIPIVSEENSLLPHEVRKVNGQRRWQVKLT